MGDYVDEENTRYCSPCVKGIWSVPFSTRSHSQESKLHSWVTVSTGLWPYCQNTDKAQGSSMVHQGLRCTNGFCNLFLHPSFPGFWLPVRKANSDLMQQWNLGSRLLGKMWMSEFWMKQGSGLPLLGAGLRVSRPSYITDVCAWSCTLFILSLTNKLGFPTRPQMSFVTMGVSGVLDTWRITIPRSALLFSFSYCGTACVSEGTALPVLLSQLPVLLLICRRTTLASP